MKAEYPTSGVADHTVATLKAEYPTSGVADHTVATLNVNTAFMAVQAHELLQLNCFMRMRTHTTVTVTSPDSCDFPGQFFLLLQMTVNKLFNSGIGAM